MLKKLFAATAIAVITAVTTTASVIAHDDKPLRWGNPAYEDQDRDEGRRRAYKRNKDVSRIRLNRWVENEVLPLRRLLNLGRESRGYRIDAVIVRIDPGGSRGSARLLVNGRAENQRQRLNRKVLVFRPRDDAVIGFGVRSLRLDVRGQAFVRNIKIKLSRDRGRRNRSCFRLERQVNMDVRFDRLNLWNLLNLGRHPGCRIDRIEIKARTDHGRGKARIFDRWWPVSAPQVIGRRPAVYRFNLWENPVIGRDLRDLNLDMRGKFTVYSVRAVLRR